MSIKAGRESDLAKACLSLLQYAGIMAWRNNTTGVYDPARKRFRSFQGMKGVSDILGCLNDGRMLAVETKSARGRLTPEQRHFLEEIGRRGGLALVVRDIRELQAALIAEGVLR